MTTITDLPYRFGGLDRLSTDHTASLDTPTVRLLFQNEGGDEVGLPLDWYQVASLASVLQQIADFHERAGVLRDMYPAFKSARPMP
jgi:hypothetical protein